jgi:hypothetical protein
MMATHDPKAILAFQKTDEGRLLKCEVSVFDDSVYVVGDCVEVIFEHSADALAEAVQYLHSLGYSPASDGE